MMRKRIGAMALGAAVAANAGGCATLPDVTMPWPGKYFQEDVTANPLIVTAGDYELVWKQTVRVLDEYFEIASEDRLSGKIITQPVVGATLGEPWRGDSVGFHERLESTLQTIRRFAQVSITPAPGGGYAVKVEVFKQLEDLAKPDRQAGGRAVFTNQFPINRTREVVGPVPLPLQWIPRGRDPKLEQVILRPDQARPVFVMDRGGRGDHRWMRGGPIRRDRAAPDPRRPRRCPDRSPTPTASTSSPGCAAPCDSARSIACRPRYDIDGEDRGPRVVDHARRLLIELLDPDGAAPSLAQVMDDARAFRLWVEGQRRRTRREHLSREEAALSARASVLATEIVLGLSPPPAPDDRRDPPARPEDDPMWDRWVDGPGIGESRAPGAGPMLAPGTASMPPGDGPSRRRPSRPGRGRRGGGG